MNRALAAKFRKHVIALPEGSPFTWRDMDAWAKANLPPNVSYWQGSCHWEGLCVECMSLAEVLEAEGWLTYQNPKAKTGDSDDYFRTDKIKSHRAQRGIARQAGETGEPWD
jgi:hypothetical protein